MVGVCWPGVAVRPQAGAVVLLRILSHSVAHSSLGLKILEEQAV